MQVTKMDIFHFDVTATYDKQVYGLFNNGVTDIICIQSVKEFD